MEEDYQAIPDEEGKDQNSIISNTAKIIGQTTCGNQFKAKTSIEKHYLQQEEKEKAPGASKQVQQRQACPHNASNVGRGKQSRSNGPFARRG